LLHLKTENLAIRAFAPANISLIFETYPAAPPHGRGSLGVGITLTEGVQATVQRASIAHPAGIFVDGEAWEFSTVKYVLAALTAEPLHIELTAAFRFGCGFGMSGASALATALAINELLQLGKSAIELGMVAHHAEVAAATGLGDVGGQFNGGIMMKTVRYEPLSVIQLPLHTETLHVRIHGPIHTADVIDSAEKLQSINAAGHHALAELVTAGTELTLGKLFDISLHFAESSGLLTHREMIATIKQIQASGGHATMIMLGEAIVSTVPFPDSRKVTISYSGGHLL
jgi:pantoate kinase